MPDSLLRDRMPSQKSHLMETMDRELCEVDIGRQRYPYRFILAGLLDLFKNMLQPQLSSVRSAMLPASFGAPWGHSRAAARALGTWVSVIRRGKFTTLPAHYTWASITLWFVENASLFIHYWTIITPSRSYRALHLLGWYCMAVCSNPRRR